MKFHNRRSQQKGDDFYLLYAFKKSAKNWKIISFILLIALCLLLFKIIPYKSDTPTFKSYIAKIYIDGIITTSNTLSEDFENIINDRNVKGVIIEINSGGGTITGSEILYKNILKLSQAKPTVSLIKDVGASGAYMAAIGTDYIIAYNTSIVGSIGVIAQSINAVKALDKIGIKMNLYKSSKYKASPTPFDERSEEIDLYVKEGIMEAFDFFANLVKERRKLTNEEIARVANGKVFSGAKALQLKLIDEIGTYDSAEKYLKEVRGLDKKLTVVNYNFTKEDNFLDKIIEKIIRRKKEDTMIMAMWPSVI